VANLNIDQQNKPKAKINKASFKTPDVQKKTDGIRKAAR
jgi:hypothetical protein